VNASEGNPARAEQWNADQSTHAPEAPAPTQSEIDARVFDLYDEYCHGRIKRREFLRRAAALDAALPRGVGQAGLGAADRLFQEASGLREGRRLRLWGLGI
jgi:hypothetical protein